MRVYLAGPINGCTDAEAMDWREEMKRRLPRFEWIDPMDRDYRGKEAENVRSIVEADLADIYRADALLVYAMRPSWGTAMEIVYARDFLKPILVVAPPLPSPWLEYHATQVVGSLMEAESFLLKWEAMGA